MEKDLELFKRKFSVILHQKVMFCSDRAFRCIQIHSWYLTLAEWNINKLFTSKRKVIFNVFIFFCPILLEPSLKKYIEMGVFLSDLLC